MQPPQPCGPHCLPPTHPHVRCCSVVLSPHSWSISLSTPLPPLLFLHSTNTTPPFFQPHYADCFRGQARKEKQIEAAGDNETAGYATAVHFGIDLSHIALYVYGCVCICALACSPLVHILHVASNACNGEVISWRRYIRSDISSVMIDLIVQSTLSDINVL